MQLLKKQFSQRDNNTLLIVMHQHYLRHHCNIISKYKTWVISPAYMNNKTWQKSLFFTNVSRKVTTDCINEFIFKFRIEPHAILWRSFCSIRLILCKRKIRHLWESTIFDPSPISTMDFTIYITSSNCIVLT